MNLWPSSSNDSPLSLPHPHLMFNHGGVDDIGMALLHRCRGYGCMWAGAKTGRGNP